MLLLTRGCLFNVGRNILHFLQSLLSQHVQSTKTVVWNKFLCKNIDVTKDKMNIILKKICWITWIELYAWFIRDSYWYFILKTCSKPGATILLNPIPTIFSRPPDKAIKWQSWVVKLFKQNFCCTWKTFFSFCGSKTKTYKINQWLLIISTVKEQCFGKIIFNLEAKFVVILLFLPLRQTKHIL